MGRPTAGAVGGGALSDDADGLGRDRSRPPRERARQCVTASLVASKGRLVGFPVRNGERRVTEIERTIRRKELDLGRYSVSAGERWLIIYAWFMRSAFFDREVLSAGMFTSTFDRVIFFDLPVQRFVAVA